MVDFLLRVLNDTRFEANCTGGLYGVCSTSVAFSDFDGVRVG
jgi:hypothetical protein